MQSMQTIVSEHEQYLDALRDFNDWLISAKEELQRWSDLSGDSMSIKRKLSKVQVRNLIFKKLYVAPGHKQLRIILLQVQVFHISLVLSFRSVVELLLLLLQ